MELPILKTQKNLRPRCFSFAFIFPLFPQCQYQQNRQRKAVTVYYKADRITALRVKILCHNRHAAKYYS